MEISVTEIDGPVTRVSLDGRLDTLGADAIGLRFTAAVAAHAQNAIVDLSRVSFIASMGMRLLISTTRALRHKGRKLVLFGATPLVHSTLTDAALEQIIPVAHTEAEALAELSD